MKNYIELLEKILCEGSQQSNRTGIDTIMIPGEIIKFDLREGFPAITTRKIPIKNIIGELIGFLRGTTSAKEFRNLGCGFWNANANDNKAWIINPNRKGPDDLGNIYGAVWNNWKPLEGYIKVPNKILPLETPLGVIQHTDLQPTMEDTIYLSVDGHPFKKLKRYARNRANNISGYYDIQFQRTGTIIKARDSRVSKGNIKDPFEPVCCGVGYYGDLYKKIPLNKITDNLYHSWHAMLSRCYDLTRTDYEYYGGKGVFVSRRWHSFSNFYRDAMLLPNWLQKKANLNTYELDKDYFGSNCYSKDTCIWIPEYDNKLYANFEGIIQATLPNGCDEYYAHITDISKKFGLCKTSINDCLLNKKESFKGFKFKRLNKPEGFNYRKPLEINQIHSLIRTIKDDPSSRRLLVSAWRPDYLSSIALPSCHYGFQVIVDQKNKILHLLWNQRSCDMFLGIPANIASYAILLHLLARITGYGVGTLTGFLSDVHIYINHINQVKLQLTRKPYSLPMLKISDRVGLDFPLDELVPEDITLENYTSHDIIKAEMAV